MVCRWGELFLTITIVLAQIQWPNAGIHSQPLTINSPVYGYDFNKTEFSITKVIKGKSARMEVNCFTFDINKDFLSFLASLSKLCRASVDYSLNQNEPFFTGLGLKKLKHLNQ